MWWAMSKTWCLFFASFWFFVLSESILANSIESETIIGSTSTEESISLDGNFGEKKPEKKPESKLENKSESKPAEDTEKFPWALNFAQTRSKSTDADNNPLVDVTNAFEALFGYESKSHFEFGGGYAYSATPNENLISLGPNLYTGYTFEEEKHIPTKNTKSDEEDDQDFRKSIGFKVTASSTRYIEAFTATQPQQTKKGKAKPTTGVNEIIQTSLLFEMPIKYFEWMTIKPSATFYRYNTDVNDFLNYLNSKRLASGTIGLQSSAASLASFEAALQATFYFLDSWELLLIEDYSTIATDRSNSWAFKVQIFDEIGNWRLGLGYSNLRSVPANDDAAIIIVSYDF